MAVTIQTIEPDSAAAALGLAAGDTILSVDGNPINDMLDYQFYTEGRAFHLSATIGGLAKEADITKEQGEFGCNFETYLADAKHSCKNKCIFCFIDQMPKGMRDTLYFKDDDERLSFLFGNYITLTNLTDHEIDRIIKMRISPINVSVHTTNPDLRVKMMTNKHAGECLDYLNRISDAGIDLNCQLVLCPGVNDGDELRRTLTDLIAFAPNIQSVGVVPVGVTRYREGLYPMQTYTPETAGEVLDILEEFGDACVKKFGKRIIFASDEWYLCAGRAIPPAAFYEEYYLLENGIGMWRLFHDGFLAELEKPHRVFGEKMMDVVTGTLIAPLIAAMMEELHRQYPMITVTVHPIQNEFFGGNVSVAGLVTATDILAQCEGKLQSATLGIPEVMLRSERDLFLDGVHYKEVGEQLGVKTQVLPADGAALARQLLKSGIQIARRRR